MSTFLEEDQKKTETGVEMLGVRRLNRRWVDAVSDFLLFSLTPLWYSIRVGAVNW